MQPTLSAVSMKKFRFIMRGKFTMTRRLVSSFVYLSLMYVCIEFTTEYNTYIHTYIRKEINVLRLCIHIHI